MYSLGSPAGDIERLISLMAKSAKSDFNQHRAKIEAFCLPFYYENLKQKMVDDGNVDKLTFSLKHLERSYRLIKVVSASRMLLVGANTIDFMPKYDGKVEPGLGSLLKEMNIAAGNEAINILKEDSPEWLSDADDQ
jgi:hypothetical protein